MADELKEVREGEEICLDPQERRNSSQKAMSEFGSKEAVQSSQENLACQVSPLNLTPSGAATRDFAVKRVFN